MKKFALPIFFSFAFFFANAQEESFNQKFLEANTLMEENQFNIALPIWLDLHKEEPDNSNVNYKIGLCYIHSANNKKKALDYLAKAVQDISSNYDPFSASEKKSPIESYFYLAKAQHLNYDLDAALSNYAIFKDKVSKKHFLFKDIDHHMEQCNNAKEAIKNPTNIKISNLGSKINSVYADYSPVLSTDESTIYFTSRRLRKDSSNYYSKDINDGQYYEDIYVSYNYDDSWSEPELLNINTEGHEATLNLSADGQTLFIFKDDNGDGNIYISKLDGEEWSNPVKLGSDINLESRETHAHISPDGNTLYYVSDRKGGLGGQDIYKCKRLPDGSWAKSQNLGEIINTPYDEDGIFVHPDGRTIYFSSKGHKSIGGYDIFSSQMDELGNWSTPVNIGYPINSTDDDVFFVTSADGRRGYYSSFQEKGYGEKDIYVLSLEDANAKPVTLLTGYIKVLGEKETPENSQVTVTDNETGNLIGIYKPRKKDGRFSTILTPGNDYHIVYSAATFKQEEDLYIPPISAYQEINRGIDLQDVIFGDSADIVVTDPLKPEVTTTAKKTIGKPIVAEDIVDSYQEFFKYNVKKVNTSNKKYIALVKGAIAKVNKDGKVVIDIESSASKVPSRTFKSNTSLAEKRAEDAKNTIIKSLSSKGVTKEKIIIRNINSSVNGPEYNGDFANSSRYEEHQYVIIKIK